MADVVEKLEIALANQEIYERVKLPTDYNEIIQRAVPPLNYGKMRFQLNMNGKHYEMISMAVCLPESEPAHFSKSESRFTVGSYVPPRKKTTFMTRIKPEVLSPNITYIMNLVFKKKKPSELYIGLEYEFKKKTYYSFLSDKREDGWSTAELFQFTTNQGTTVDELEIRFNIKHFKVIAIEGIEFRPLDEVKHGVLVDDQMNTRVSDTIWRERLESMDNNARLPTRVVLKSDGWRWEYLPETSFEEVRQDPLSKFRIFCNIESKILSRDTTYATYLVYIQKADDFQPAPAQVEDRNSHSEETLDIYLQIPQTPVLIRGNVCQATRSHRPSIKCIPQPRRDGWMEVQIWEFKTNPKTANIPMNVELSSYDKRSLKRLEVKGIEFRPRERN
nr:hypothetical protein [Tanacetum cinerariifolium]